MKILIVEDEKLLADSLKTLLESKGFDVETVYNGISGAEYAELGVYDLLILDVMMPGHGRLRRRALRPRETVRCADTDADGAFKSGGPCGRAQRPERITISQSPLTRASCSRASTRCCGGRARQVDALSFGNTTLDLASGTLCCAEKSVRLSAREFDVMRLLLQSGGSNLSKEALLSRVWGFDSNAVENSVEVYVGFLRKKLASIGSNVRIESVRRLGYHLEVASSC